MDNRETFAQRCAVILGAISTHPTPLREVVAAFSVLDREGGPGDLRQRFTSACYTTVLSGAGQLTLKNIDHASRDDVLILFSAQLQDGWIPLSVDAVKRVYRCFWAEMQNGTDSQGVFLRKCRADRG